MQTDEAAPRHLDPEVAARLDRLAQRRRLATPPAAPAPASTDTLDTQLADRLARLQSRRTAAGSTPASGSRAATPPATAGSAATKPAKRRRRHPAKKSRIAAVALSVATTGGLAGGFAALDGPGTSVVTAAGGVVQTTSAPVAGASTAQGGVVDGDVYVNKWGPVQVEATFGADGSLIAVDAIQTPYVDSKSVRINDQAVPRLNSEALGAQSAQVDTVSGATYTSTDYERSLQSALDAARAAGLTQLA